MQVIVAIHRAIYIEIFSVCTHLIHNLIVECIPHQQYAADIQLFTIPWYRAHKSSRQQMYMHKTSRSHGSVGSRLESGIGILCEENQNVTGARPFIYIENCGLTQQARHVSNYTAKGTRARGYRALFCRQMRCVSRSHWSYLAERLTAK